MKLLLDENLPQQLRHEIPGHDCFTVGYMGWAGLENGELLARAALENFDALVTKDTNLKYQQNLVSLPIAVVVLQASSNDINDIRPILPALLGILPGVQPPPGHACALRPVLEIAVLACKITGSADSTTGGVGG